MLAGARVSLEKMKDILLNLSLTFAGKEATSEIQDARIAIY
jgi:hypothetical protein